MGIPVARTGPPEAASPRGDLAGTALEFGQARGIFFFLAALNSAAVGALAPVKRR